MREYLRVTPTSEGLDPEGIPRVLESLHKLTTAESTGFAQKLNPHSKTPPKFEFLALSEGADDPVEFFYGADEHLDTLEKRLRSIYPETFDIERVDVDVASRLVQPVEFTPAEFIEYYERGSYSTNLVPTSSTSLAAMCVIKDRHQRPWHPPLQMVVPQSIVPWLLHRDWGDGA